MCSQNTGKLRRGIPFLSQSQKIQDLNSEKIGCGQNLINKMTGVIKEF